MLEGSAIAAILTGVLALVGAIATAWMSGWNDRRVQARQNRKALARYAVPLLIAGWDLANWFYDILEESNYSPQRCKAYGSGWNSKFTSYLIGQYFAGVHIMREKTHFLAHIRGERADLLKRLLWKIQDEFVSMHYEERESLEMRWFEGDILAVQEHMTEACDLDGDGNAGEMRAIGYVEFQQNYEIKEPGSSKGDSLELKKIFGYYETEFQRVIYRRFKHLYSTRWKGQENPQGIEKQQESPVDEEVINRLIEEERLIKEEQEINGTRMMIPDHRIRRLQHLLSDLVELLDEVSKMKFNRPSRRCEMLVGNNMLGREVEARIPCDCHSVKCNPEQQDFEHRQLAGSRTTKFRSRKPKSSSFVYQPPVWPDALGLRRTEMGEKSISQC
ncbi:hypothetical protein LTS08_004858 [Lithohypha guttulata]|uniref:Uncharacterized protein n=1 Tax=Lithohypha guttulata TaxID=1690604 RepID=A0AAN7T3L0_9EURO|nr:hypothetical protein LTR05_002298 [Lithohypha guttulata]KAK5101251.1 hypothetical protein LTS08_004858 [Lithohypha guttulata]